MIDIPSRIWVWMGSEDLSKSINETNEAAGLVGQNETIIINLLVGLLTKKDNWPQFITNLNEALVPLVGEEKTKQATGAIKNILSPMKKDLADFGIFIDGVDDSRVVTQESSIQTPESADLPSPVASLAPQPAINPIVNAETVKKPEPQAQDSPIMRPAFKNTPFVIHEADVPQAAEEKRPEAENEYFYHPSFDSAPKFEAPAPVAQIETALDDSSSARPISPTPAQAGAPPSRVVHYSELRTPVDPFGRAVPPSPIHPQNVLNLKPAAMPEEKPSVHPDNVVNLKDLPVEEQSQNPNLKSQDDN